MHDDTSKWRRTTKEPNHSKANSHCPCSKITISLWCIPLQIVDSKEGFKREKEKNVKNIWTDFNFEKCQISEVPIELTLVGMVKKAHMSLGRCLLVGKRKPKLKPFQWCWLEIPPNTQSNKFYTSFGFYCSLPRNIENALASNLNSIEIFAKFETPKEKFWRLLRNFFILNAKIWKCAVQI